MDANETANWKGHRGNRFSLDFPGIKQAFQVFKILTKSETKFSAGLSRGFLSILYD